MLRGHKNTKKQGDVGLGLAIGWFTSQGYTVSVPLTDSQDYDLVADISGKLKRVQVKTTTFRSPNGVFTINLSVKGGNRTSVGTVKKFDPSKIDSVFVATESGDLYYIPSRKIAAKHSISLGEKWAAYRLNKQ
jgi:hypothetical protein